MDNCNILPSHDEFLNKKQSYYETANNTFHVAATHNSGGGQHAGTDS